MMLRASVRRVLAAAPSSTRRAQLPACSMSSIPAMLVGRTQQMHQRRYSSSKPSSPKNSTDGPPTTTRGVSNTSAAGAGAGTGAETSGEPPTAGAGKNKASGSGAGGNAKANSNGAGSNTGAAAPGNTGGGGAAGAAGGSSSAGSASGSAATTAGTKTGGAKKGRRAKNAAADNKGTLPLVPSTQNVPHDALALSDFFSLHRPMSVTQGFPTAVTEDHFNSIFQPWSKAQKQDNVTKTVSRAVESIEQSVHSLESPSSSSPSTSTSNSASASAPQEDPSSDLAGSTPRDPAREAAREALLRWYRRQQDPESSIYSQLNAMSGPFRPFQSPPVPASIIDQHHELQTAEQQESEAAAAEIAAAEDQQEVAVVDTEPHHRTFQAVFTIDETREPNGDVSIVAHSPRMVPDRSFQRKFLERMALRQMVLLQRGQLRHGGGAAAAADNARAITDAPKGDTMLAISVRRQRKLKMKKKKFKKLLKRTRNDRRKQDRL